MNILEENLNKVVCIDCVEFMKMLGEDSIDVSLTSPPYNYGVSKRYPNGRYNGQDDSMDIDKYRELIFNTIDELLRITKHYVFFNIQRGNGNGTVVFEIFGKYANKIKDVFVWAKTNPPNGGFVKGLVASGHEYIFCFSNYDNNKRSFERYNFTPEDYVKNVIIEPVNSDGIEGHNAVFPDWLPIYFIKNFTFEGDIVFDPFSGSGKTGITAIKMGRKFIGTEINKNYCVYANNLIDKFYTEDLFSKKYV